MELRTTEKRWEIYGSSNIAHSATRQLDARLLRTGLANLWHAAFTAVSIVFNISFTRPASLYREKYTHTNISDCVETVYELPLLPNNAASAPFLHKSVAVRSVDWVFIVGVPAWRWLDECVRLDRTFYSLLFKQEAVAAQVLPDFLSYLIPRRSL